MRWVSARVLPLPAPATTSSGPVRARTHTLQGLEQDLARLAVPAAALRASVVHPTLGVLPLTAHVGPAQERITAALAGGTALPPPFEGPPPWAAEQCEAWVTAVGGAA